MKNRNIPKSIQRQQGSVTLIVAFTMVVIIAFAGLAIDTGRNYGVKAQLSAAADAGALAGARALAQGTTQAERITNAEQAALRFFNLNYPDGFQNSAVGTPNVSVLPIGNGRWNVTVNAQADTTTTFMKILGRNGGEINSVAQAIRVNPDIMMVLDSSGSIGSSMPILKAAAKDGFVSKFIPDVDGDRLGVVSFAAGSVLNQPINKTSTRGFNRTAVNSAIDSLVSGGWTVTSDAMRRALDDLNAVPQDVRSDLRVMLVFSDGAPNVLATEFNGARGNWTPYNGWKDPDQLDSSGSNPGVFQIPNFAVGNISTMTGRLPVTGTDTCKRFRATRNVTENVAAMARQQGIVVYTIGMGTNLNGYEAPDSCGFNTPDNLGSALLRRLANTDEENPEFFANEPRGLYCFAPDADDLEYCFSKIANDILRLTM